ncbi:PEP-CTERM sorting domain-containing protein [Oleidesulfovibrio sp.]|uniref:PEP-CTERM sorting domain-containing protein n=1 Tax=Oleidesulfovibrio sp. TaxID=2909707 RepID=UPI003A8ABCD3
MRHLNIIVIAFILVCMPAFASASVFTMNSLTSKGTLPGSVSEVGGIVIDLVGLNDNRVVAQLAASGLYIGYAAGNPQVIGTQTGFSSAVVDALGGGLSEVAVRVSLWDGDTAAGEFDYQDNNFLLNGFAMQDFSDVLTQTTDGLGVSLGTSEYGFGNQTFNTGFFYSNDSTFLSNLYASLAGGSVEYSLDDVDFGDNYYDFTQGVDASLINVGTGPVVNPTPTPEPATMILLAAGLGILWVFRRRTALN